MRPMMLAQTIVELPKYGARRREAAISVESVPAPAVNTSSPRRRRLTVAATGKAADGAASASVRQPQADEGAVVPEISACESAAVLEDGLGELLLREVAMAGEHLVEPRLAVQLAVASTFDDAVGVQDDRGPRLQASLPGRVFLPLLDAEREAVGGQRSHTPVGPDDPCRRMAGAPAGDAARLGID